MHSKLILGALAQLLCLQSQTSTAHPLESRGWPGFTHCPDAYWERVYTFKTPLSKGIQMIPRSGKVYQFKDLKQGITDDSEITFIGAEKPSKRDVEAEPPAEDSLALRDVEEQEAPVQDSLMVRQDKWSARSWEQKSENKASHQASRCMPHMANASPPDRLPRHCPTGRCNHDLHGSRYEPSPGKPNRPPTPTNPHTGGIGNAVDLVNTLGGSRIKWAGDHIFELNLLRMFLYEWNDVNLNNLMFTVSPHSAHSPMCQRLTNIACSVRRRHQPLPRHPQRPRQPHRRGHRPKRAKESPPPGTVP